MAAPALRTAGEALSGRHSRTSWLPLILAWLLLSGCSPSDDVGEAEGAAPPAPAGPSTYLALGDSVAAGAGAPADEGYVPLLAGLLRDRLGCDEDGAPGCPLTLENLAESGATTGTLRRRQLPRALELLADRDVRLITVTIGGNDVFEPVVRGCAAAPRSTACRDVVRATLQLADEGIDAVLGELAAAAGPGTTLAVMTYYDPLPACRLAPLQPLAEQVLEGDGEQSGLNDLLRERAQEHDAVVVETRERLSAPQDFVGDTDCLHPSPSGHERIARAFDDAVGSRMGSGSAG